MNLIGINTKSILSEDELDRFFAKDTSNKKVIDWINAGNSHSTVMIAKGSGLKGKATANSFNNDSIKLNLNFKINPSNSDTTFRKDSGLFGNRKFITLTKKDSTSEKLLIEGVKVFLNIVNDTLKGNNYTTTFFSTGLDTTILKKQFDKKLSPHNLKSVWITRSDSIDSANAKIYFKSTMLNGKLGVAVENYTFYLLKKLTPNILFSLLLLLTTGAAFIISYINLKKQMQLNSMRDEFVSNITHELKTPVATVKVALEALSKFNTNDNPVSASGYINMATQELDRLDILVQKVLNASILENNSSIMNFETIDLEDTLKKVLKTMQVRFDNENASITLEITGTEFKINADRIHIQGVIINLLDNSLKYTNDKPGIQINLYSSAKKVELSVSDNGPGIPEDYLSKVFEKFFRVPADNKHNVKGYGLGLNYALMVMKQHGGSITVINNEIKGCTFTLTFPKIKEG